MARLTGGTSLWRQVPLFLFFSFLLDETDFLSSLQSGQQELADAEARLYVPSVRLGSCLYNCGLSVGAHNSDLWDHILVKHIGHTPFSCCDCTKRFAAEKQMRRHLKEIHKKEKAKIDQIIAPLEAALQTIVNQGSASNSNPSGHFEVDPQAVNSPGQFLLHLESPDTLQQTNSFVHHPFHKMVLTDLPGKPS